MKVNGKDDIPYIMENKQCLKPPTWRGLGEPFFASMHPDPTAPSHALLQLDLAHKICPWNLTPRQRGPGRQRPRIWGHWKMGNQRMLTWKHSYGKCMNMCNMAHLDPFSSMVYLRNRDWTNSLAMSKIAAGYSAIHREYVLKHNKEVLAAGVTVHE